MNNIRDYVYKKVIVDDYTLLIHHIDSPRPRGYIPLKVINQMNINTLGPIIPFK